MMEHIYHAGTAHLGGYRYSCQGTCYLLSTQEQPELGEKPDEALLVMLLGPGGPNEQSSKMNLFSTYRVKF